MVRFKEALLGVLLILFVLGTTIAGVLWGDPVASVPQDDSRPPLTLAEPVEPLAQVPSSHHAWRDVFPAVYAIMTVALVIFAGLVCALNCFRQFVPYDKILNKFPKINRMNFT